MQEVMSPYGAVPSSCKCFIVGTNIKLSKILYLYPFQGTMN